MIDKQSRLFVIFYDFFVEKLRIQNYKCFRRFEIDFNEHLNIIVGNNEEGKSIGITTCSLSDAYTFLSIRFSDGPTYKSICSRISLSGRS